MVELSISRSVLWVLSVQLAGILVGFGSIRCWNSWLNHQLKTGWSRHAVDRPLLTF